MSGSRLVMMTTIPLFDMEIQPLSPLLLHFALPSSPLTLGYLQGKPSDTRNSSARKSVFSFHGDLWKKACGCFSAVNISERWPSSFERWMNSSPCLNKKSSDRKSTKVGGLSFAKYRIGEIAFP